MVWHALDPDQVIAALNSDRHSGLTAEELPDGWLSMAPIGLRQVRVAGAGAFSGTNSKM